MMADDPFLKAARDAGMVTPAVLLASAVDPDKPWMVYGAGCIVDVDTISAETLAYWRSSGRISASGAEVQVPVQITSVVATPGSDTADITWDTNYETDSQVQYGADASYGSSSVLDPGLVINHAVQLSVLTSETEYHFAVVSNGVASPDATFTTEAAPAP